MADGGVDRDHQVEIGDQGRRIGEVAEHRPGVQKIGTKGSQFVGARILLQADDRQAGNSEDKGKDFGFDGTFAVSFVARIAAPVTFNVSGANANSQIVLYASTDNTGKATQSYTGSLAGADLVQASAIISGMLTVSDQASITWTIK